MTKKKYVKYVAVSGIILLVVLSGRSNLKPLAIFLVHGSLIALVKLSVFILAYLLGQSGYYFRQRLAALQLLKRMKQSTMKGSKRRYYQTIARLCFAPVWCIALYLFGMYFLKSTVRTIFIVVGPILPVLGYFGMVRELSDDDV